MLSLILSLIGEYMSQNKVNREYVSPIDQFLTQFDRDHPHLSKSQQKEKAKYSRIYYLRDVVDHPDEKKLPGDF